MNRDRIAISLDTDLFERVQALARQRKIPFEDAIDAVVRSGLDKQAELQTPYQVPTYSMGWRPDIDLSHALRVADELEDKELTRELQEHNREG